MIYETKEMDPEGPFVIYFNSRLGAKVPLALFHHELLLKDILKICHGFLGCTAILTAVRSLSILKLLLL